METTDRWPWAWVWLVLSAATAVAVVFAVWEVMAHNSVQDLDDRALHYLYITHGIALALLLAAWAVCIVLAHRRTYSAQLRQSAMNYRRLIEEARDAIVVFDPRGIVREWNPQAFRLFGFHRHEILGRPLPTLPPGTRQEFFGLLAQLADRREAFGLKYAARKVTKHGEVLAVSLSICPLRDEWGRVPTVTGNPLGWTKRQLWSKLPAMLARAGYLTTAAALDTELIAAKLPEVEAKARAMLQAGPR